MDLTNTKTGDTIFIISNIYFDEAAVNEEICIDLINVGQPNGTIENID